MLHALVDTATATVLRIEDHPTAPPALATDKRLAWRPVTDIMPTPGLGETLDGPAVTITDAAVQRVWTIRQRTFAERLAECHAARRAAYPAVGDQLDAAYKARQGDPSAQVALDAAIAAVKAAHPKPAAE